MTVAGYLTPKLPDFQYNGFVPISCSVVLAPTAHKPIQSHTFLHLNAPANALTRKEGVFAIMTGSLIAILREHLQPGDGVPVDIAHILQG